MFLTSMLLLFLAHPSLSQKVPISRSHSLTNSIQYFSGKPAPDSLTIIAIRVEFQEDSNRLTTGDGTFSTDNLSYLDSPEITIDPLPHNRRYFENHLTFVKNYYETVSAGQMSVDFRVLPDIFTLPKKMETYSPTGQSFTNEKVAQLVKDSWQEVRQSGGFDTSGLNPEKTAFAIFHAGVGRDIKLTGTSLDITPQDIPSLFLDQKSLSKHLDNPNFEGFSVNGGSFRVKNSMVLPRTLSRPGENITGKEFVLQLSINGLLAASIGSYLGLPDLFNTDTGSSGIGRFGLMDGESFFSYRGLFPPEPSAWEKIYLGWQRPFTITNDRDGKISLTAASYHQQNSIAKYSLSGSEYFLVENRHRDPASNGITLTVTDADGNKKTMSFDNHDQTFVNQSDGFTDLLEPGVVTDVDNFDWSLPGGFDSGGDGMEGTNDDQLLNGGMLIWHIDEAIIAEKIGNQAVNSNPERRGVDLEEADGAQDIGQAVNNDFSTQARGTAFDFWWKGNDASVITLEGDTLSFYENRFGPDTSPSNHSNSGARSFFEFYAFSGNTPVTSFKIRPVSSQNVSQINLPADDLPTNTAFTPNTEYFNAFPWQLSLYTSGSDSFLVVPDHQTAYGVRLNNGSSPVFDFKSGTIQQPYLGQYLIFADAPNRKRISLSAWNWDGSQWNNEWIQNAETNNGFISSINDRTLLLDFTDQRFNISDGSTARPLDIAAQRTPPLNGNYALLNRDFLTLKPENASYSITSSDKRLYSGNVQISKNRSGFFLLTDDSFTIFDKDDFSSPLHIIKNTPLEWPALVDFNKDGLMDILYVNKNTHALEARNLNGAMLSYFPIYPPKGSSFTGTPLIAETKSGNSRKMFITSQDSLGINIHGFDEKGHPLEGFPLYVGAVANSNSKLIHPLLQGNVLYAVSHLGKLKAWQLGDISNVLWGSRYGNFKYNKISAKLGTEYTSDSPAASPLLIKEETYNWPNPAKNYTNLRFQTSEPGKVDVKIITPGGSVVYEKQFESRGGTPEEYRINTQSWSSGLYLAMVTAQIDGRKDRKMIKMVVIH